METMMNTPRPTSMFSQEESIKKNILVLDVLKKWIPPLAADEREQLEQNILQFGCKDPLMVWETTYNTINPDSPTPQATCYVLLDGHNRYEICQKYTLDFKINLMELQTMQDAQDFMIDHQLGRRNLSVEQMAYLRGMKYLSLKQERGKYERSESNQNQSGHNDHFDKASQNKNEKKHSGHNDHYEKKEKLSQQLATEYNVGEKTIRRDADFAKGVELLPTGVKNEVLQGKSSLNKKDIIALGKIKTPNQVSSKLKQLLSEEHENKELPTSAELKDKARKKIIESVNAYLSKPEDCDELLKIIRQRKKQLVEKLNN